MGRLITKFQDSENMTETIVNKGDIVNDCPITDIWVSSVGTPLFTIDGNYYTWRQLHEMLPEGRPIATTEYVTEEDFNMSEEDFNMSEEEFNMSEEFTRSEEEYKTVTSGL